MTNDDLIKWINININRVIDYAFNYTDILNTRMRLNVRLICWPDKEEIQSFFIDNTNMEGAIYVCRKIEKFLNR